MPYVPFHEKFPDVAKEETRAICFLKGAEVPRGTYLLTESYCDEENCDCRRVFFNIFSDQSRKIVATIAWGWEKERFYAKWLGDHDPSLIKDLKGPVLNLTSRQSKIAPILLNHVTDILEDENYVERIKRHYRMFREAVEEDYKKARSSMSRKMVKIGRNDPCPCGSGKNYKKCCLKY